MWYKHSIGGTRPRAARGLGMRVNSALAGIVGVLVMTGSNLSASGQTTRTGDQASLTVELLNNVHNAVKTSQDKNPTEAFKIVSIRLPSVP